jgi:feruloyl-CoA synthase
LCGAGQSGKDGRERIRGVSMNALAQPTTAGRVEVENRADGVLILRSPVPMGTVERSVCVYLERWAADEPERMFLAQRRDGEWQTIDYGTMWARVQAVGQALLDRGLSRGDTVAILSGNSIEHAIVTFAAMSAGLVVSPISPNYSLLEDAQGRLREIAAVLKPAVVFAQNAAPLKAARNVPELAAATWISATACEHALTLSDLYDTLPGHAFATAFAALDPDAPAKILFTSGSTGSPKGVINTHAMMASSVAMGANLAASSEPPMQLCWLPWHHTMGGNATLNGVLKSGGTIYIDDGRPTRELFGRTLANLRGLSPTAMLNAPLGYEMLVDELERNSTLRTSFFEKLQRLSYAGSAIPASTLQRLQVLAAATVGRPVPVMSGYGTTETAPGICTTTWPSEESGEIGLPLPGIALKLVPVNDYFEVRVKGPNVMPGYLERPKETQAAFDDEGYYCVGDTVTFMDRADPNRGLRFHGRLSESFKLTNGTWVVASELRLKLLNATGGLLQDLVVAGENRASVAVLAWVNKEAARAFVQDAESLNDAVRLAADAGLREQVRRRFEAHNAKVTSSERVSAFALLHEPPSLARGETTDKAYINQRAVLSNRAAIVAALYADAPSDVVTVVC